MELYSTNNTFLRVGFGEAVLKSLPEDNGLYMPVDIPLLPDNFYDQFKNRSFQEVSFEVAKALIGDSIPHEILRQIVNEAINFEAPVVPIHDNIYSLELFHGPTLAFKDFGARFMSRVMKYFKEENKKLYILVATSGDTGGAVASGFYEVEGIEVIILFPKNKVSPLQQKQLTTLGKNITAIEIDGNFDDCQAIVKQAFLDKELTSKYNLSSANSINISRLIPQTFYYFNAVQQLSSTLKPVFVVPSGNFGNITAGVIAYKMGLPIHQFVAATNINDVVPEYTKTGVFKPKKSVETISNAMDVGNPSNFYRMTGLLGSTWNNVITKLTAYAFDDEETKQAMKMVYSKYNYILDPHGAVGYLAAVKYQKENQYEGPVIFLETAHPSKFIETVESTLNTKVEIPEQLMHIKDLKEKFSSLSDQYSAFKQWFSNQF